MNIYKENGSGDWDIYDSLRLCKIFTHNGNWSSQTSKESRVEVLAFTASSHITLLTMYSDCKDFNHSPAKSGHSDNASRSSVLLNPLA